jgi:hypothetical protein
MAPNAEMLDDLIQRYLELYRRHGHTHKGDDRRQFDKAQRELWALAQAICKLTHPKIQSELDAARRDAVAQINLHIEHASPIVVSPRPKQRPISWTEFQLTPELSVDPQTTGACVSIDVAKRLRFAHKNQISAVYDIVHRRS